jgi:hypothetical protein
MNLPQFLLLTFPRTRYRLVKSRQKFEETNTIKIIEGTQATYPET